LFSELAKCPYTGIRKDFYLENTEVPVKFLTSAIVLAFCLLTQPLFAALDLDQIDSIKFPAIDVHKVHNEDVANEKLGEAPRFAIVHEVAINPFNTKSWKQQADNLVWRYRIQADRAVSINLAFKKFNLSANAHLKIMATDLTDQIRDFTAADNNVQEELWTPVIMSSDILVELIVPKSEIHQVKLELNRINQGYRTFSQTTLKAGSCNVDVVCSQGDNWRNEINAVGVISTGGSTFCTGFMINNTRNDREPYFMTAKHCRIERSNAPSLVVYWNYQASKCGGRRDGKKRQFNTGSTFLSSSSKSDFTLVRLSQSPDPSWNVQYAGWDRTGEDASQATAIHHPATDEKSISFEYQPTTVTSYLKNDVPGDSTHVRVEDWDVGTTEPGSSGSPLFDQNHRVIGQLHGGYASCSSQTSDWYGRIYTSWEGDGSSDTRLKDWLDQDNTGDLTTDTI
jgi:lysyl endopeptidase